MNTLIEQIKKGQEAFDSKFVASNVGKIYNWKATALTDCTGVRKWHKQFLISLLEGERERQASMLKDEEKIEVPQGENIGEYRFTESLKRRGYNSAITDQISHIDEALAYLKNNV